jgi:rare lipoprotein A
MFARSPGIDWRKLFQVLVSRGLAAVAAAALVLVSAGSVEALGASDVRHTQFGLASYYGPGFNGGTTASGEVFDERELVAAHRTLPLGTVVRVTNLENDRSVVLRVIDRGPYGRNYRKGCIIDVSKGAARRLRFITDGLTRVRVQVLRLPRAGR